MLRECWRSTRRLRLSVRAVYVAAVLKWPSAGVYSASNSNSRRIAFAVAPLPVSSSGSAFVARPYLLMREERVTH